MFTYKVGDILAEDVEAIVNTVNCVGVMGRGIALQFKKAFPANFSEYAKACKAGDVVPGRMFITRTGELTGPRYIINFPTKRHWRGKSRMEDIDAGLSALRDEVATRGIKSIAIPPLGSGLGGLEWSTVKPRIEQALHDLSNVQVIVYEPSADANSKRLVRNREVPDMTPGRAALVVLMYRYLAGLLDPFITLIELQKLMYFMQEAGEPLRLNYKKGYYGPYAENLRHVLNAIEGHLVSGYGDGGDDPEKELALVPGAVMDAEKFLEEHGDAKARFAQVSALVEGFETPFGLELLATAHWVVRQEKAQTLDEVITTIHKWNDRKKQFTPRQISLSLQALSDAGWLEGSNFGTANS